MKPSALRRGLAPPRGRRRRADGVRRHPVELETYRLVARVAGECMRANLPLVVEALPCPSERIPDPNAPEAMASAARISFEHGADLVKSYYTEDFEKVTENCPVPVVIAGGPKMDTVEETLQVVQDATRASAAGVVFGRNIWPSGDTRGMIQALQQESKALTRVRSQIWMPAISFSSAGTAYRFNGYDERCRQHHPRSPTRHRGRIRSPTNPVGAVREPSNDEPHSHRPTARRVRGHTDPGEGLPFLRPILGREASVPRTTLQCLQTRRKRIDNGRWSVVVVVGAFVGVEI
jgi:hypothetical protein